MHVQERDLKPFRLQRLQRMKHGVVLKGSGNNVLLSLLRSQRRRGPDRLVIRLAPAGCEDDLPGICADYRRDVLPGLFKGFLCVLPVHIQA